VFVVSVVKFKFAVQNQKIMSIQVGQQAPEFSLYNTEKNKVSLSDFKGKNVLLLFFPQSFTGVCTKELCAIRDDISRYNQANAVVFGISVDSVFTQIRFHEEQKLNFQLLSDFNKEVSRAYGAIYEEWILDMKGVSKRSAFIVDKEGKVAYAEVLESPADLPNFEAINQTLEGLA
jgi:peroxiredoxin